MSEFICARCGYACSRCICKRPIGLPANHEVADLRAENERLRLGWMDSASESAGLRVEAERLRAELKVAHSVLEKLSSPPLIAGAVVPPSWDWQKQEETK